MALESGTRLAHYEITDQIGKGGMGEVYRARDTKLGREVAIKILPSEFAQDQERLARLEREARMLAALNHPNIAAIHGLEESDDTPFLVLELVEGDTLADRLKSGAVPVEESLRLALQIAEALEEAHERGVIHRDLKPANIKITPENRVKVLDFGLAKAFIGEQADVNLSNSPTLSMQATQQGVVLGTAGYMSPEQAGGAPADHRADIWAFGVVLFEMLSGKTLFAGKTVTHVLASVVKDIPAWDALPPNLHSRVRFMLESCLEKEPRDRCHSISEARVDLQKALAAGRADAVPVAPTSLSRRVLLGWGAAAGATGVALGGVGVWSLRPEIRASSGPVARFPITIPDGQLLEVGNPMLAISPDGTRIAWVANQQLYLRSLDDTEPRPIPGPRGDTTIMSPVFSPDSQWLIYVNIIVPGTFAVERVQVGGGTPQTLMEPGLFAPRDVSWERDDLILFETGGGGSRIMQMPARGGTPTEVVIAEEGESLGDPHLLPGGEWVLFSSTREGGVDRWDAAAIFAQPLAGGERRLIWEDGGGGVRYVPTGHLIYGQGSTLFAVAFDAASLEVIGSPVSMVEGVRRSLFSNIYPPHDYNVSATGSLVYIPMLTAGSARGTFAYVDPDGSATPLRLEAAAYRNPRVSPDGTRLAYARIEDNGQSHVWVYDLAESSNPLRITQEGSNIRPIWKPDGAEITFASNRDGQWRIYSQAADGRAVARPLTEGAAAQTQFPEAWSPDGETLLYNRPQPQNALISRIFTLNAETGEAEELGFGFGAAFNPGGDWIAYTATVGGDFGIDVRSFPFSDVPSTPITRDGETWPVWSGDGSSLFYRTRQDVGLPLELRAADISIVGGAPTFRNLRSLPIGDFASFVNSRDYDVAGDRLIVIVPADADGAAAPSRPQINVVLNWFTELRDRVPVP